MLKRLSIIGSTGSIGAQTLDLVEKYPDKFKVESLAAGSNLQRLREQIRKFKPRFVSVIDPLHAQELKANFPDLTVGHGESGACEAASWDSVDLTVVGIVGFSALRPTLAAVRTKKTIALANKECLVAGGSLLKKEAADHGAKIIPVDSEHNAVFQLLQGFQTQVDSIVLTASGGPLLRRPDIPLDDVTPAIAVKHPKWSMGPKISVDSATLMNKGLEVIEAHYLFDLPEDKIEVWIHPQSILHGALILKDNSVIAHLSQPDMHSPIGYALEYPGRLPHTARQLTFHDISTLEFMEPDLTRFPCLHLAREALRSSPHHTIALNAANEIAVDAFLSARITFASIPRIVESVLDKIDGASPRDLDEVFEADRCYRTMAAGLLPTQS